MKKILAPLLLLLSIQSEAQFNSENIFTSGELQPQNNVYEIAYKDTRKEIFSEGAIRNDPYKFMMDNGAPVFISTEMQDRYKFPVIADNKVTDANGKVSATKIVLIDSISFGPFHYTNIAALVFDLNASPLKCDSIAGNLGSNILRHLVVRFDIAAGKISFINPENQHSASVKKLPMTLNRQCDTYFPVAINDAITDTIHFDTGDGYLYHISEVMANKVATQCRSCIVLEGTGITSVGQFGAGEKFKQYVIRPLSIWVADTSIGKGIIYQTADHVSRMGRALLNYGVLELDYPAQQYSFQKYGHPIIPAQYDYGFVPLVDGGKLIAGIVWKGSAAATYGLKSGDEIREINGIKISALTDCGIDTFLRKVMLEKSIKLKIKKGNALIDIVLRRSEL